MTGTASRASKMLGGHELAVIAGSRSDLPPRARYTPEQRLADMDSLGVDIHVLQLGFKGAMIDDKINGVTLDAPNFCRLV